MVLGTSRGYETLTHKAFMRSMVILADVLLLIPSIWYAVQVFYKESAYAHSKIIPFLALAAQPGLLLIDHGHFQFNNISLGLSLLAVALIMDDHDLLGAMCFSFSLNYKQMSLYYAPAMFFFLLSKAFRFGLFSLSSYTYLAKLGITVIASFALCWLPFLIQENPIEQVQQLLSRIFPVSRGLYEDKVANFWCSISPVFKLQLYASHSNMVKICLVFTVVGILPASLALIRAFRNRSPSRSIQSYFGTQNVLLLGLTCTAWSFFFFSFHVHEKSVLLPIFMMSLWILKSPTLVTLANTVSTFSMLPLLQRDGHEYSLIALLLLYVVWSKWTFRSDISLSQIILGNMGPLLCYLASKFIQPPPSLPDLWALLLTSSSFAVLFGCFAALHLQLYFLDAFGGFETNTSYSTKLKEE